MPMRIDVDCYYEGPRRNNWSWSFYPIPHLAFGYGEGDNEDQRQLYVDVAFAFWSVCLKLTYTKKDDEGRID